MSIDFSKIENIKVDVIVGFGEDCRVAQALKRNRLRFFSSPFDWEMKYSLSDVINILSNNGKTFFMNVEENLARLTKKTRCVVCKDTGMISLHEFSSNLPFYDAQVIFHKMMSSRFKKLDKILRSAKTVCIITSRRININEITVFIDSFKKLYSFDKLYFMNVYNCEDKEEVIKTKLDNSTTVYEYYFRDEHPNGSDPKENPNFWYRNVEYWDKIMNKLSLNKTFVFKNNFKDNIFKISYILEQNCVRKIINILGLKIKIKIKDKRKDTKHITNNYKNTLNRIRSKCRNAEKIKVVFLVSENQKWGYQSLYNIFDKSEYFEPLVLVYLLEEAHSKVDRTRNNLEENYNFFKSRNMNIEYLYKNGAYMDLKDFMPDIVFYEQMWGLPENYMPTEVSKYALTFFCSYSFEILNDKNNYLPIFHKYLYKYFIEHRLNKERYKRYTRYARKNCVIVGYPKLDAYFEPINITNKLWKESEKVKIIYAPHHSFDTSHLATFDNNGKFILELAKKHPETTWIFKPHPRLKFALLHEGLMNETEIEKYYSEWAKIGTVYTQGDYIDIFKSSDAMITDCLSFLAEYLPSQKPLIRLINKDAMNLNELGNYITSEYYNAENNEELENIFDEIVLKGNDYKKDARLKLIKEVIDYDYSASQKIFDYICNLLSINEIR